MNKAAFLDRDGTINSDSGYLYKNTDFIFLAGAREGLRLLQDMGYLLIIVTNQSGIARGYYSEEEYLMLDKWLKDTLLTEGIRICDSYYCPHHPEAEVLKYRQSCDCRKPGTGLFTRAAAEHGIDMDLSVFIGDRERDVSYCRKPEGRGQGYVIYSDTERSNGNIRYIRGGLLEAAEIIRDKSEYRLDRKNS